MANDYEWEHDDQDVPYSAIKPELRDFIENHYLANEAASEHEFNQERGMAKHPHGGKVFGGLTALGALLGAIAGGKFGKAGKVRGAVGGGLLGTAGGAVGGGIAKGFMNKSHRDKEYGPARYDAYSQIADDIEDEAARLTNQKMPLDLRTHSRIEREKLEQERMKSQMNALLAAQAIRTAGSLGNRYMDDKQKRASFYKEEIEKLAKLSRQDKETSFFHDRLLSSMKSGLIGLPAALAGSVMGGQAGALIGGALGKGTASAIRAKYLNEKMRSKKKLDPDDYAKTFLAGAGSKFIPGVGLTNTPEAVIKYKMRTQD